jgi:hypothetical protein
MPPWNRGYPAHPIDVDFASRLWHHRKYRNEHMKLSNFSLALVMMVGLASASLAADYADWVAKGYRWSAVHGRVAFVKKEEAMSAGNKSKSDSTGHGYYLRPGKLVLVLETDDASGLSRIRMNGAASPLWTATKNLSSRPVKNARGVIESPESTGLRPHASQRYGKPGGNPTPSK